MADLLAAANVLVHCTGGMTCLEASAHGCPVIAYGLGAGHIAHNTSAMVRLGLIEQAPDVRRLRVLIQRALGSPPPAPSRILDRPSAAAAILALAGRRMASGACALPANPGCVPTDCTRIATM